MLVQAVEALGQTVEQPVHLVPQTTLCALDGVADDALDIGNQDFLSNGTWGHSILLFNISFENV